jgi:hypothetical protein
VSEQDLVSAVWRKSTRSSSNGDCVEVADNLLGVVAIRDSKNATRGTLRFASAEWKAFLDGVKLGEFDHC